MGRFWGVVRYEFGMQVRRRGLWIAIGVLAASTMIPYLTGRGIFFGQPVSSEGPVAILQLAYNLNFYLPAVIGIFLADRFPRDAALGVDDLLASLPLSRRAQVVGKLVGSTAASILPLFLLYLGGALLVLVRDPSLVTLGRALIAFPAINLPGLLFVAAFSIACPAVIPVRAYQVLFFGYWVWGTMINPAFFPTLNGTWITPNGTHAFHFLLDPAGPGPLGRGGVTLIDLVGSIATQLAMGLAILIVLDRYLAARERRA